MGRRGVYTGCLDCHSRDLIHNCSPKGVHVDLLAHTLVSPVLCGSEGGMGKREALQAALTCEVSSSEDDGSFSNQNMLEQEGTGDDLVQRLLFWEEEKPGFGLRTPRGL